MGGKRGYILVIVVVIIAAILTLVVVGTTLRSLTGLETATIQLEGQRAEIYSSSCMQEALLQLARDADVASGGLSIGVGTCNAIFSAGAETKTVTTTATFGDYTKEMVVEVQIDPFVVTNWDEYILN